MHSIVLTLELTTPLDRSRLLVTVTVHSTAPVPPLTPATPLHWPTNPIGSAEAPAKGLPASTAAAKNRPRASAANRLRIDDERTVWARAGANSVIGAGLLCYPHPNGSIALCGYLPSFTALTRSTRS